MTGLTIGKVGVQPICGRVEGWGLFCGKGGGEGLGGGRVERSGRGCYKVLSVLKLDF